MPRAKTVVQSDVAKNVAKEVHACCRPLAKQLSEIAASIAEMKKQLAELQAMPPEGSIMGPVPLQPAPDAEVRAARFSPGLIKKLRARLGITQAQLAALLGVTGPAVAQWETGTSEPRGGNKGVMVTLRKLGRRDIARMLLARGMRPPKPGPADEE